MALPCTVKAGQLTIRGLAIGGIETCYQIQPLGVMFDIGHCPRSLAVTPNLFITHGHADHAGGLLSILSLRLVYGVKEPLKIFAPAWMVSALQAMVAALESLQDQPYRAEWTAVEAGQTFSIGHNRSVLAFRSPHVIPTMGYTIIETAHRLKAEFLGRPGEELANLKKQGVEIQDSFDRPLLSFPGDTTIGVLDKQPHPLETRVLLLESTYLDDRKTVRQCTEHGHVHLDQILERAGDFRNEHLVLTHFSQAYRPDEAKAIVKRRTAGLFRPEVQAFVPEGNSWPG